MIKQAANNLLHQIMSDFQTLNKKNWRRVNHSQVNGYGKKLQVALFKGDTSVKVSEPLL